MVAVMTHPPKTEQDFVSVPRAVLREMRLADGACGRGVLGADQRWDRALADVLSYERTARISAENDRFPTDQAGNDGFRAPVIVSEKRVSAEDAERAWRNGWSDCKAILTDDEAFCLTDDVEEDAWRDSATRAALSHPASPVTDPVAGVEVEGE